MKYNDFPYKRLDIETQKELMAGWLTRFENAETASEQITVLKKWMSQAGNIRPTSPSLV